MTTQYIGTKTLLAWEENRGDKPGYAVQYPDGYVSWSPKDVFEEAYRAFEGDTQKLTFGDALYFLKRGKAVARLGWNGKGLSVSMQAPEDDYSKMTLPYLYLNYPDGRRVPWFASQTDMLEEDWMVL